MVERSVLNSREPLVLKSIQHHSRPLRLALAAVAGLALLTACAPADPKEPSPSRQGVEVPATPQLREITPQQIEMACQITAPRSEYDPFTPYGVMVQEKLVRPPGPRGINREPVNSNIVLVDRNWVEHPITNNPDFDDDNPQLSPDGKRVVFVRRGPLELIDKDRNIVNNKYTGMEGIYTINIDGTDERRVTNMQPKVSEENPTWSPDGSRILFVRGTYGDFPRQAELMSINSDGTDLKSLTTTRSTSLLEGGFTRLFSPTFSPDGSKIAYQDGSSTYVMGTDGNNNRLVSRGVSLESPEGVDRHFVWLPDSQELVIYKQYRINNIDLGNRKFVFDKDGSAFADLTPICPPSNAMPSS